MSALLIDGRFVAVFPRLVRALAGDVTAAAVLQAVHYRMQALDRSADPWLPMYLSEIAEEIGISSDQAQRATKRLRECGLLGVRGGRGQMREWTVIYDAVRDLEEGDAKSRHLSVAQNRGSGDAQTRQGDAQSRHYRRDIASDSFSLEERETREDRERSIVRKPVVIGDDPTFDLFWQIYPRREGKAAARTAWVKALRKTDISTIMAGAERYRDDPNREAAYTAHAATWLNGERWTDEPLPPRESRAERKMGQVTDLIRRAAERDTAKGIEA